MVSNDLKVWNMQRISVNRRFDFKDIGAAGVDYLGFAALADTFEIIPVTLMNMAVRHQLRRIFIDKIQEGFEPAVREILIVAELISR